MKNKKDVYQAALRFLNYKSQSEYEITYKLKNRGYTNEEINKTIEKLKKLNYINDEKLSIELFNYYKNQNLLSNKMIHQKLKQKGLYINLDLSETEELNAAKKIVNLKFKISNLYKNNPDKLIIFLARKGFPQKIIYKLNLKKQSD